MTTIAIVGAGPELGAAVARRFGAAAHGPVEVLQYSPLPQKDFMRPITAKDPEVPAGTRWHLHATRDRFSVEVATG